MCRDLAALPAVALSVLLAGCETIPRDAFRLSESAFELRELQTREYTAVTDRQVLTASTAVLQDLGYAIDEAEPNLGVVSASKRANATNQLQALGTLTIDGVKCAFTLLLLCDGKYYGEIDDIQDIRLTLVTRPQRNRDGDVAVRVTIQRIVWDKKGRLSEQATVTEDDVYAAFFDKLSKAVFLEQEGV